MFNHKANLFYEAVGLTEEQAIDILKEILDLVKNNKLTLEYLERAKELPNIGLAFATVHFLQDTIQICEEKQEPPIIMPDNSLTLLIGLYQQIAAFGIKSKAVQWLARWNKEALAHLTRATCLINYDTWVKLVKESKNSG